MMTLSSLYGRGISAGVGSWSHEELEEPRHGDPFDSQSQVGRGVTSNPGVLPREHVLKNGDEDVVVG